MKTYKIRNIVIVLALISLFALITPSLYTISGESTATPNSLLPYSISLNFPNAADSDYTDGTYSEIFGSWALIDSSSNIVESGEWEKLSGTNYNKNINIKMPLTTGTYYVVSTVVEYDYIFDAPSQTWSSTMKDLVKDAKKIDVDYGKPTEPITTTPTWSAMLSNLWAWILNLFGI